MSLFDYIRYTLAGPDIRTAREIAKYRQQILNEAADGLRAYAQETDPLMLHHGPAFHHAAGRVEGTIDY